MAERKCIDGQTACRMFVSVRVEASRWKLRVAQNWWRRWRRFSNWQYWQTV